MLKDFMHMFKVWYTVIMGGVLCADTLVKNQYGLLTFFGVLTVFMVICIVCTLPEKKDSKSST